LLLGERAVLWQFACSGYRGTFAMGQSYDGMPPQELQSRIDALQMMMARTRHDVRSALAPAMLAAEMLKANPDPKVQRSGATMVRAIERVLGMLDSTRELAPTPPPA